MSNYLHAVFGTNEGVEVEYAPLTAPTERWDAYLRIQVGALIPPATYSLVGRDSVSAGGRIWDVVHQAGTGNIRIYNWAEDGSIASNDVLNDTDLSTTEPVWLWLSAVLTGGTIKLRGRYSTDQVNHWDDVTTWSQSISDVDTSDTAFETATATSNFWVMNRGNGNQPCTQGDNVYRAAVLYDNVEIFDLDFAAVTADELEATVLNEPNGRTVNLTGDEWAYVRYRPTIAGKTPELLLEAGDGNKGFSPKWADRSGNNHHAQRGSAAGADTNDSLFKPWNGIDYLYLPGTSGNYASTADVNLLDADTAHLYQSKGHWSRTSSRIDTGSQVAVAAAWSGYGIRYTVQSDTSAGSQIATSHSEGAASFPISASTEYSATATVVASTDATLLRMRFRYYNGGSYVSQSALATSSVTAGVPVTLTLTETSPAGIDNVVVWVYFETNQGLAVGETFDIYDFCFRAGSDATFVPSLRIVGDLEVEAKVAADDWTLGGGGAGYQYVFGTLATSLSAADGGWHLSISDVGAVTIMHSDAALADLRTEQSALYTLVDGEATTIKVTFDNSGLVTYYQDGVEVDDDVVTNTGAAGGGTSPLCVGTFDGAAVRMFNGDIYYLIARDGIGGPIVAEYRASDAAEPFATHTGSVDGRTWTHNRSASGLVSTVVDRDMELLTTDDCFTVADNAALDFGASDSMTAVVAFRASLTPTTVYGRLLQKRNNTSGYQFNTYRFTGDAEALGAFFGDGTDSANTTGTSPDSLTIRTLTAGALRANRSDNTIATFIDGVEDTIGHTDISAVGDTSNADPLYIGGELNAGFGDAFFEGQIIAVALFREALTDAEIAAVGNALVGEGGATNMMLLGVA